MSLLVGENVAEAEDLGFRGRRGADLGHGVHDRDRLHLHGRSRSRHRERVLPRRPHHQARLYGEWQLPARPLTLGWKMLYRGSHFDDSDGRIQGR